MRSSWLLGFPGFQIAFVALAVACWLAASTVTDSRMVQLAVLFGVGVVLPTVVSERVDRWG